MDKIGWKSMNGRKSLLVLFALSPFLLFAHSKVYACPGCDDLLNRGREALGFFRFSQGIAWTILLLLSVPFAMTGIFAYIIWRSSKHERKV